MSSSSPATAAALGKIERAHQMYREGLHGEALGLYTEALALARTKPQKIALHSNRAACYLKLNDFRKAAEECTSVLELDHQHTGALMLRAQTLVTLKDYQSALFDVNRLMDLNPSSDVYRNLQARLRTQLSLAPIPESEEESYDDDESALVEEDTKNSLPSANEGLRRNSPDKLNEIQSINSQSPVSRNSPDKRNEIRSINSQSPVSRNSPDKRNEVRSINPQSPVSRNRVSNSSHPEVEKTIPKPKGHSALDYSRWDRVEESSEEEDEEEEEQPQYRFRVRTVGVRPVK